MIKILSINKHIQHINHQQAKQDSRKLENPQHTHRYTHVPTREEENFSIITSATLKEETSIRSRMRSLSSCREGDNFLT